VGCYGSPLARLGGTEFFEMGSKGCRKGCAVVTAASQMECFQTGRRQPGLAFKSHIVNRQFVNQWPPPTETPKSSQSNLPKRRIQPHFDRVCRSIYRTVSRYLAPSRGVSRQFRVSRVTPRNPSQSNQCVVREGCKQADFSTLLVAQS
jgi:hypothetical protein